MPVATNHSVVNGITVGCASMTDCEASVLLWATLFEELLLFSKLGATPKSVVGLVVEHHGKSGGKWYARVISVVNGVQYFHEFETELECKRFVEVLPRLIVTPCLVRARSCAIKSAKFPALDVPLLFAKHAVLYMLARQDVLAFVAGRRVPVRCSTHCPLWATMQQAQEAFVATAKKACLRCMGQSGTTTTLNVRTRTKVRPLPLSPQSLSRGQVFLLNVLRKSAGFGPIPDCELDDTSKTFLTRSAQHHNYVREYNPTFLQSQQDDLVRQVLEEEIQQLRQEGADSGSSSSRGAGGTSQNEEETEGSFLLRVCDDALVSFADFGRGNPATTDEEVVRFLVDEVGVDGHEGGDADETTPQLLPSPFKEPQNGVLAGAIGMVACLFANSPVKSCFN